jgi:DNA-binding MarR family transcriptional regulator
MVFVETNRLESHLGYWLRLVSNRVSSSFAQTLQSQGLSIAEWVVLARIHDHTDSRPADLAAALNLTRGAISKILDKLESKDWISRAALETDNRVQLLTLTPGGKRILPKLTAIADRNDEAFFGALTDKERAALRHLLQKIGEANQIRNIPIE